MKRIIKRLVSVAMAAALLFGFMPDYMVKAEEGGVDSFAGAVDRFWAASEEYEEAVQGFWGAEEEEGPSDRFYAASTAYWGALNGYDTGAGGWEAFAGEMGTLMGEAQSAKDAVDEASGTFEESCAALQGAYSGVTEAFDGLGEEEKDAPLGEGEPSPRELREECSKVSEGAAKDAFYVAAEAFWVANELFGMRNDGFWKLVEFYDALIEEDGSGQGTEELYGQMRAENEECIAMTDDGGALKSAYGRVESVYNQLVQEGRADENITADFQGDEENEIYGIKRTYKDAQDMAGSLKYWQASNDFGDGVEAFWAVHDEFYGVYDEETDSRTGGAWPAYQEALEEGDEEKVQRLYGEAMGICQRAYAAGADVAEKYRNLEGAVSALPEDEKGDAEADFNGETKTDYENVNEAIRSMDYEVALDSFWRVSGVFDGAVDSYCGNGEYEIEGALPAYKKACEAEDVEGEELFGLYEEALGGYQEVLDAWGSMEEAYGDAAEKYGAFSEESKEGARESYDEITDVYNQGKEAIGSLEKPCLPSFQAEVKISNQSGANVQLNDDGETILNSIELGEDDLKAILGGAEPTITMDIKNTDPAQEDKDCIAASLGGYKVGRYLDIALGLAIGGGEPENIETLKNEISITIAIPEELINTDGTKDRTYGIIRLHGGVAEMLGDVTAVDGKITFKTDKFSTYAIVYKDAAKPAAGVEDPKKPDAPSNTGAAPAAPNTGDAARIEGSLPVGTRPLMGDIPYAVIAAAVFFAGLMAMAGIMLLRRKKRV